MRLSFRRKEVPRDAWYGDGDRLFRRWYHRRDPPLRLLHIAFESRLVINRDRGDADNLMNGREERTVVTGDGTIARLAERRAYPPPTAADHRGRRRLLFVISFFLSQAGSLVAPRSRRSRFRARASVEIKRNHRVVRAARRLTERHAD